MIIKIQFQDVANGQNFDIVKIMTSMGIPTRVSGLVASPWSLFDCLLGTKYLKIFSLGPITYFKQIVSLIW